MIYSSDPSPLVLSPLLQQKEVEDYPLDEEDNEGEDENENEHQKSSDVYEDDLLFNLTNLTCTRTVGRTKYSQSNDARISRYASKAEQLHVSSVSLQPLHSGTMKELEAIAAQDLHIPLSYSEESDEEPDSDDVSDSSVDINDIDDSEDKQSSSSGLSSSSTSTRDNSEKRSSSSPDLLLHFSLLHLQRIALLCKV